MLDPSIAPYVAVALIFLFMGAGVPVFAALALSGAAGIITVSYTHLTLPTIYSV